MSRELDDLQPSNCWCGTYLISPGWCFAGHSQRVDDRDCEPTIVGLPFAQAAGSSLSEEEA